jgi:hypothetical protein
MEELVANFFGFISWRNVLIGFAIFLVTFTANLAVVSFILIRLPADYFKEKHKEFMAERPAAIRWAAIIGKNLLGVLLVALGLVLSVPGVPGQGILTILLGIMLLDFPGRRTLERKLIGRPKVLNSVNKLRSRFDKPPLVLE